MTRKIKLTRSQVEMAKSMGIPLEEVAKMKLPKRGRPKGSKNKPKMAKFEYQPYTISNKTFDEEVAGWESEPREPIIDWKELAQKLQNALGKAYADNQVLDKHITLQNYQLTIKQKRVDELEFLLAGAVMEGDFSFEDDDEDSSI